MVRRRKVVRPRKADVSDHDSDDERSYRKMPAPDPDAPDYCMDEVDEFNENRDKILLEKDGRDDGGSDSENQEEIFSLDYSDSDDDDIEEKLRRFQTQQHLEEIASDVEEEGAEPGLPDAKAWGKRKKEFYHTDYVDDDLPGVSGSDEDDAQDEEEREALAIQKRMSQMMEETDFDLDIYQGSAKTLEKKATESNDNDRVIKDLSKLSKRDKLEILKKESPEFLELVEDFKVKLKSVKDTLYPLLGMLKDGRIPQGPGADYINTKFKLFMNYCVNISFYMTLKAKHVPVHNHPVIGRILAHKKLIKELEPLDEQLEPEIKELLATAAQEATSGHSKSSLRSSNDSNEEDDSEDDYEDPPKRNVTLKITTKDAKKTLKKSSSRKGLSVSASIIDNEEPARQKRLQNPSTIPQETVGLTTDEQNALEYYEKMAKEIEEKKMERRRKAKELQGKVEVVEQEEEKDAEDAKRAITYQISKNKGLTPHRKKEQRNPRVKNRMKFKKAKVRRKGQVREVRTELARYGGEVSGIRAGVIKSIKIK